MRKIIHFENTSRCNAACPMCARNVLGEGCTVNLSDLSFSDFQKYCTTNIVTLEKIFFCGVVGDPAADRDLLKKIEWIKRLRPNVTVGFNTNGSIRNPAWWQQCADLLTGTFDYVVFSIDGLADTNSVYRVGVQWEKVMANAQAYIDQGGSAHWDMLVFDHNKHQVEECKQLAHRMGFTWFRSKETDRWDQFEFETLKPVQEYKKVDYNSVDTILCERNLECSTYIDYQGQEFPCCHIAEMYYSKTAEHNKDILEYTPKELMTEYQKRLDSDPFYVCKRSCGKTVNKRSQWKQEIQLR